MFVIYKIVGPAGKAYVGKTCQSLKQRWSNHISDAKHGADTHFKRAIRKYGREAFALSELAWAADNDKANWLEKHFIRFLNSNNPEVGYNSTEGGDGVSNPAGETLRKMLDASRRYAGHSPDVRAKISAAGKGRKHTPESKELIRIAAVEREAAKKAIRSLNLPKIRNRKKIRSSSPRTYGVGRKLSDEHKHNISVGLAGRVVSPDTRARISASNKGKPRRGHSEETKRKISAARIGRKFSAEHKLNLSISKKRAFQMSKEKNSLVPLSPSEIDSYRVKGSDFPAPKGPKAGEMSGQDELVMQSTNQMSPRSAEGEGADGPSVWGKGGTEFKVEMNKGEGGEPSVAVSIGCGVDFKSGQITPNVSTERD